VSTPSEPLTAQLLASYYDLVSTGWAISGDERTLEDRQRWASQIEQLARADGLRVLAEAEVESASSTLLACGYSIPIGLVRLRDRFGRPYSRVMAYTGDERLPKLVDRDYGRRIAKIRLRVATRIEQIEPGFLTGRLPHPNDQRPVHI
jgi:hypothetical protein